MGRLGESILVELSCFSIPWQITAHPFISSRQINSRVTLGLAEGGGKYRGGFLRHRVVL